MTRCRSSLVSRNNSRIKPLSPRVTANDCVPNQLAEWELLIEEFRVFYDVDLGEKSLVKIEAIGYKDGGTLLRAWRGVRTVKTVAVPPQAAEIIALLEQARVDELLVRTADGSEFLLTAIDEFDREIARTRQNAKLMALLDELAKQAKTIPLDEVNNGSSV